MVEDEDQDASPGGSEIAGSQEFEDDKENVKLDLITSAKSRPFLSINEGLNRREHVQE